MQAHGDEGEEKERCRAMKRDALHTGYCSQQAADTAGHSEGVSAWHKSLSWKSLKEETWRQTEVLTSPVPSPFIACLPSFNFCLWGANDSTVLDQINQPLGCLLGSQISWPRSGLSSKSASGGLAWRRWDPNKS